MLELTSDNIVVLDRRPLPTCFDTLSFMPLTRFSYDLLNLRPKDVDLAAIDSSPLFAVKVRKTEGREARGAAKLAS